MKRCLFIIFFIVTIMACKNDHPDLTNGENKIDLLRAEFEKQTGYNQSQVNLLTPSFRSKVDWSKAIYKGEDTVLVTVKLLDTVIYPINGSEINLNDNVILKAVRNKKLEWSFTTVIFVPTSIAGGYSGLILSRPLSDKAERIRYYSNGSIINSNDVIRIKFANTSSKSQSGSKLRAGCTYAYVNGILNQVTCTPPEKGEREDDPGFGEPGDYFPPGHGGGSGGGTSSPSAEDKEIIDSLQGYPCAQAVLAKLPNLKNKISAWLSKEFNKSIENDITFRVSTKLDASVDGVWNNNNGSGTVQTISLNANMLSKASQEYIAATMFHEALHGFLYMEEQRLKNEGKASQFGILYPGFTEVNIGGQVRFVKKHSEYGTLLDDLAAALRSFNPNMSDYDAMALSKVGVVKDFNDIEKGTVINHRDGNYGTTCK
ncbi:MAG: hypothetical protein LBJ04_00715 [Sphingobacterium sp.]|jgi:hypothetical protein|nr:hypothetical protein [Sphingobacterium sp.]